MKYSFLLFILAFTSGFSYTAGSKPSRPAKVLVYPPDSTYSGEGDLSYNIGNRKVHIKGYLHTGGKNIIALYINEVVKRDGNMVRVNLTNSLSGEVINFTIADKGATHILHYSPGSALGTRAQGLFMFKYDNYYADDVTVKITANDNKHVVGTFAGKFISDNKRSIEVSDGSFDVPYKEDK